jgi:hypothetical protein
MRVLLANFAILLTISCSGCFSVPDAGHVNFEPSGNPSRAELFASDLAATDSLKTVSLGSFTTADNPRAIVPSNRLVKQETEEEIISPEIQDALAYLDAANSQLATQIGYEEAGCSDLESAVCGDSGPRNFFERVAEDHRNFYSPHTMKYLGVGFLVGGVIANTNADKEILEAFDDSFNSGSGSAGNFVHQFKDIGDHWVMLPIYGATWGVGTLLERTPAGGYVGEWGERSLRATAVGFPPLILTQLMTGAGRPEEGGSEWSFWNDSNGVSGHSFIGAIPFMTAAQQVDNPWAKALFYAGSTLVPISRMTDGDHYPSQSFLGWWLAMASVMSVDATEDHDTQWRTIPLIGPDYSGLNLEFRW